MADPCSGPHGGPAQAGRLDGEAEDWGERPRRLCREVAGRRRGTGSRSAGPGHSRGLHAGSECPGPLLVICGSRFGGREWNSGKEVSRAGVAGLTVRGQRVSGCLMQAAWSCCVTFQVQWSGGGVITVLMIQAKQRGEGAGGHAGGGARSAVQESGKGRSEGPAGGREGRVGRGGGDVHVGDRPLAWGAPVPVGASSINHTPNE